VPNFVSLSTRVAELANGEKSRTQSINQSPSISDAPGTETFAEEKRIDWNYAHQTTQTDQGRPYTMLLYRTPWIDMQTVQSSAEGDKYRLRGDTQRDTARCMLRLELQSLSNLI